MRRLTIAFLFWVPLMAWAQGDAIRMLVVAPPGGGTDAVLRLLAKEAAPFLSEPIVVQNSPAAGGIIAIEQMNHSAPNGKTLVGASNSAITVIPHLLRTPYTIDDYIPLLGISSAPYAICAGANFPASTPKEFVEALKSAPGKYTIGTDGGTGWLATQRVFGALGVSVRNIPFKGASEIFVSFMGNHVDLYSGSVATILGAVKADKAKCFLLTTADRSPALPGAAGLREFGLESEETPLWRILVIHKETPPETVKRLEIALEKAAKSPAMQKLHDDAGERLVVYTGQDLKNRITNEYQAMGRVADKLGIKPQ